jgi:hypothetical protein
MASIIVGIGGTGAKVVSYLAHRVKKHNPKEFQTTSQFLIIDSDVYLEEYGIGKNHFINIGDVPLGAYGPEWMKNPLDPFKKWWPKEVMPTYLTSGCGMIRLNGRAALKYAIEYKYDELAKLQNALNSTLSVIHNMPGASLNIYLIFSIAGGTGAGIFMDLAFYIYDFFIAAIQPNIRALIFLPSIYIKHCNGIHPNNHSKIRAAGYAALKELEACMDNSYGRIASRQSADSGLDGLYTNNPGIGTIKWINRPPFDFCFVFNDQNTNNQSLEKDRDYYKVAADALYFFNFSNNAAAMGSLSGNFFPLIDLANSPLLAKKEKSIKYGSMAILSCR